MAEQDEEPIALTEDLEEPFDAWQVLNSCVDKNREEVIRMFVSAKKKLYQLSRSECRARHARKMALAALDRGALDLVAATGERK